LISRNIILFLVTGAGLESVQARIISKLPPSLRKNVILAHCSGAEVCGYDPKGEIKDPYLSTYNSLMNNVQKQQWRKIVDQLINEFQLETTPTMPVTNFKQVAGDDPFMVMKADRGPQITLEFVNSYNLTSSQLAQVEKKLDLNLVQSSGMYDLRVPFYNRAEELLTTANLPVHPHLDGVFALDLILENVSKTSAISSILTNQALLAEYRLPLDIISQPNQLEIWGDKFTINGGSDRKMCLAVDPRTRAIDFRREPLDQIGEDYNIQIWTGRNSLHKGLEEYLLSSI